MYNIMNFKKSVTRHNGGKIITQKFKWVGRYITLNGHT